MKISYILQLKDFATIFLAGTIIGIFYGLINLISIIKRIPCIQILLDFTFSLIATLTLIIMINIINMGEFRFFLLIGYILGFICERITLGKLFAKGFKIMYTSTINLLKNFSNTKIGKVIFK